MGILLVVEARVGVLEDTGSVVHAHRKHCSHTVPLQRTVGVEGNADLDNAYHTVVDRHFSLDTFVDTFDHLCNRICLGLGSHPSCVVEFCLGNMAYEVNETVLFLLGIACL